MHWLTFSFMPLSQVFTLRWKKRKKMQLFSAIRLTIHIYLSRKRSRELSKTLFKPEEFENVGFALYCGTKHVLKTGVFENDYVNNHVISLSECPLWQVIIAFSNFSVRRSVY